MDAWEQKLNWRSFGSIRGAIEMAPPVPGVYAFGKRAEVQGLPSLFEWAYVGRSDRLQARLKNHLPHSERNFGLRAWLLEHINNLEVWFAETSAEDSRIVEVNLVRGLKPIHNQIRYTTEKENE
jgi:excinuclease UvrABC nuclease subunit